jgi:hypothetical protein
MYLRNSVIKNIRIAATEITLYIVHQTRGFQKLKGFHVYCLDWIEVLDVSSEHQAN